MRGSNFGLDWENCGHFLEEFGNDRVFSCGGSSVYWNIIFVTKIVVTCNLMRRKNVELWMPKSPLEVLVDVQLQVKVSGGGGGVGVLPHKRLMGMCRWMGLHFLNWSDYNGVANFRILGISRDPKWEDSRLKKSESCCLLNLTIRLLWPHYILPLETTLIR